MSDVTLNGLKRFLCGIGLLVLAVSAQGASFDCGRAGTKVEHIICDDPVISKLDEELSAAYKAALKYKERADFIRRDQGKWLNKRNLCTTSDCIKRLYEMQILILPSPTISSEVVPANNIHEGIVAVSKVELFKESFRLINGNGVKVCDAYEKNLNSFISPGNKYNQINPVFSDFSKPDSAYLSTPPDSNIYPEMLELVWARDLNPAGLVAHTFWRGTKAEYGKAEDQFFHGGESHAFSPVVVKMDIDNDGKLENVILATFCGSCGHLIFVAQDDMLGLDYAKTRLLVQHPTVAERGILRAYVEGEWKMPDTIANSALNVVRDAPHAADYGILTHEGKNYFYMMWNDPLLLQKDGKPSGSDYSANRLHLYLAEKQVVREVCTYQFMVE